MTLHRGPLSMPLTRLERNAAILVCASSGVTPADTQRFLAGLQCVLTVQHVRRIAKTHGVPFIRPQDQDRPTQARLDSMYRAWALDHGWNYGYRYVRGGLEELYPRMRFSHSGVLRAMVNVNPVAAGIRQVQAARRLARRGVFYATHFGELWQSDMNWMLERWSLGHAIVYDMGSHSVPMLVAMCDKLTISVWNEHAAVIQRHGLPLKWSNDKGTETYLTAFVVRCTNATAGRDRGHHFLPSKLQSGVERFNGEINVKVM